jgi:exosortase A
MAMNRGAGWVVGRLRPPSVWQHAPVQAATFAALCILALHWRTAASIVAIWWRSETFAHGFIVVPICLWLAWRRRDALARIPAEPWWPGLALVLLAGMLWLVASVADTLGIKQFALVFMIQAALLTILGTRVARASALPLAFLLFAVPAGEFLVPTLMDWTADFLFAALRGSGVPVYREANHFIIPSGRWSVVEACSGVRYVIASFMVGTIYAALAYTSMRRRALFIAASIVVPVVANWLRAYLIVMIGHLSNNRLAVGVDHLIYGWVFFGLVMALLFWVGSFWQQAPSANPPADEGIDERTASGVDARMSTRALFAAALAACVAAGLWVPLEAAVERRAPERAPAAITVAGADGWSPVPDTIASWKPRYKGFASEFQQTFRKDGQDVGLYIAYYRGQEKGRELVTSGNQLVSPGDWDWRRMASGSDSADWAGRPESVDRAEIKGDQIRLLVYRLYWVDGRTTSSEYVAKARLAWSRFSGRGDDAALVVMYTPVQDAGADARATLRAFASSMSPAVEQTLLTAAAK